MQQPAWHGLSHLKALRKEVSESMAVLGVLRTLPGWRADGAVHVVDLGAAAGWNWGGPSLKTASHPMPWAICRRGAPLSTRKASEAPWAPPLMPGGPLKGALEPPVPHFEPTGAGKGLTAALLALEVHAARPKRPRQRP